MRKEQGLDKLIRNQTELITVKHLSSLLLEDLKNCHCLVYGKTKDDEAVLLAELNIIADSLSYEMFDQRIEFAVAGEILSNQYPPLTYKVEGETFGFYGRCSTVPKVCGVDLYFNQSYSEIVGDIARQNFKISVKALVKKCKSLR